MFHRVCVIAYFLSTDLYCQLMAFIITLYNSCSCADAFVGKGAVYANTKQFKKAREEFLLALKIDSMQEKCTKIS